MGFSVGVRKRKKKPYYFKTEKEALAARRKLLYEKEKGTLATGPQQTLKMYLEKWLEQVCKVTMKPTTYEQYRSTVRHHLIPALGHIKLQKLTTEKVQEFSAQKQNEGTSRRRLFLFIRC